MSTQKVYDYLRVAVFASPTFSDQKLVLRALSDLRARARFTMEIIQSGGQFGVDLAARLWVEGQPRSITSLAQVDVPMMYGKPTAAACMQIMEETEPDIVLIFGDEPDSLKPAINHAQRQGAEIIYIKRKPRQ
jgi:hypothetical protein